MNLTRQLIELNKSNIVPKKFDTKLNCITYILSYYKLKYQINGNIFDLFYDLKLRQLQHICHKVKDHVNNDEPAFEYLNDLINFLKI
jgi:hypothetical protein